MSSKIKPETKHPDYEKNRWAWRLVRDCIEGESAIKRADTSYLPMPSGMRNVESAPQLGPDTIGTVQGISNSSKQDYFSQNDPSYHANPAYMAYKKRAHFPDISANTQRGLMGLVVRGEPDVDLLGGMEYLFDNATKDGKSLADVYDELVNNQLTQGRFILSVDIDEADGKLKIVTTKAKDFINWKKDKKVRSGISLGVFERHVPSDDEFSHDMSIEYVCASMKDGKYSTTVYGDEGDVVEAETIPSYMGKSLDFLPIVIAGSTIISPDVDIIPMYGIANVAVQMYQKSADLSMSEFMSCNPMLTLSGVEADETPKLVGSTVVLTLADPSAKAYYPATDTSALTHVMEHIDRLSAEAESYGANLLNNSGKGEAAETLKIRQFQNGANLLSVIDIAGAAMTEVLSIIAEWMGIKGFDKIFFDGNKEFTNSAMSAQEQTALLQSWMAAGISKTSYLWNMKRAGMLQGTVEEELDLISKEPPAAQIIPKPAAKEDSAK